MTRKRLMVSAFLDVLTITRQVNTAGKKLSRKPSVLKTPKDVVKALKALNPKLGSLTAMAGKFARVHAFEYHIDGDEYLHTWWNGLAAELLNLQSDN